MLMGSPDSGEQKEGKKGGKKLGLEKLLWSRGRSGVSSGRRRRKGFCDDGAAEGCGPRECVNDGCRCTRVVADMIALNDYTPPKKNSENNNYTVCIGIEFCLR